MHVSQAQERTMRKSPVKCETNDYGDCEFDLQIDFSQFLEEARQHAREVNFQGTSSDSEEVNKGRLKEEKKIKKSWKNSLFSWWKAEKKSKPSMEPASNSHTLKQRRTHVSGPISGSGKGVDIRYRCQTSGSLTNLFNPTRKAENEMPYMCLDQLNKPHSVKTYGHVYLVT